MTKQNLFGTSLVLLAVLVMLLLGILTEELTVSPVDTTKRDLKEMIIHLQDLLQEGQE